VLLRQQPEEVDQLRRCLAAAKAFTGTSTAAVVVTATAST
jgi:hypothetical protein